MRENVDNYELYHYPKSRVATFDVGRIGNKKHHIAGILEIDVSLAREKIRNAIKSGQKISFTSWFLKVLSTTIVQNRFIHSINYKKGTQISFGDVDISIPIERKVDDIRVPLVTVIRKTNTKTVEEINKEIRNAAGQEIGNEKDYVLEKRRSNGLNGLFFNLPQFVRMIVWKYLLSNPFVRKDTMGTLMVTNVAMAGNFPGWIIPKSIHNLCFGIGSIIKKPWVYKSKIEIREILNLTILFDHDVVDGSPAARFTAKLVKNIEDAVDL
jgi:pyruvate/2-oxoglutarate dehydrogenase complex dihydrolipoamide acyltransferase (E2) component